MTENSENKKVSFWEILGLILFIALIIIVFIATFGQWDISKTANNESPLKDDAEIARKKSVEIEKQLNENLQLKNKLATKYNWVFMIIRVLLVSIWAGYLGLLWYFGLAKDLEDLLNYSQAFLLFVFTINFLAFGNIANMNKYVNLLKIKTKNTIYSKYRDLDMKIEKGKKELAILKGGNDDIIQG